MDVASYTQQFPSFLKDAAGLASGLSLPEYANVVAAGVGENAVAAGVLSLLFPDISMRVVRSFTLPATASEKTLVLLFDYLGNTEEMLTLYQQAQQRKCSILAITSGGKLYEKCIGDHTPYVHVPSGIDSRIAYPYLLLPLVRVLSGKTHEQFHQEIIHLMEAVQHKGLQERANELAAQVEGMLPLLYSSVRFQAIAQHWKRQYALFAKQAAFTNTFPALTHDELELFGKDNRFHITLFRDEQDSMRVRKRMEKTQDVLHEQQIPLLALAITGKHLLTRILTTLCLGDLTALTLAKRTGADTKRALTTPFLKVI